jgi:uracil-DNA glycosylase
MAGVTVDLTGYGHAAMRAALVERVRDCRMCPRLRAIQRAAGKERRQPMSGCGSTTARLMILVDEPTEDEMAASGITDHTRWIYLMRLVAYAWICLTDVPPPKGLVAARNAYLEERRERGAALSATGTAASMMADIVREHVFYSSVMGCAAEAGATRAALRQQAAACRKARVDPMIYALDPQIILTSGTRALNALRVVESTPPEAVADGVMETMVLSTATREMIPYSIMPMPDIAEAILAGSRDASQAADKRGLHYGITSTVAEAIRLVDRLSVAAIGRPYIERDAAPFGIPTASDDGILTIPAV